MEGDARSDGAFEYEEIASFDSDQDSEDEVCGLADAFQQFEARLFQGPSATESKATEDEEANAEEGRFPAYVYMSDQFRDGLMEETIEYHEDLDDDLGENLERRRLSPITAHVEEVLDALTLECFSFTVAPMLTSFYKTMLEKQQQEVRTAREEREAVANRTIEEQLAFKKAQRLKLEQDALEEAARVEALENARQEEELKEAERREILLKQQLDENDEEEIKVKTLAYTHTREWHQPNKKCFSHRGRQLTYLKPVLQQSKVAI
ncbi:hypothetical protein G195_006791 [Phytophthora kernoviae 00238/432]|uniref:Uncharacterized protein n=2 Tax=Phytophthora kernoviae TaxID=325452 RepID=A0A8T0LXE9_9STRA|nr:hypothetical protein G195_006791 [Phytophthora kernoviae 00238/432]KAG2522503.1 hypothetical protein JM16_005811 [Phytophthora kernoviae]